MDTDIEVSKEYQDAIDGDRALALRFWQQIADNKFDGEARLWIVEVAGRVIKADKAVKGTARLQEIVNAVCLARKEYPHIELRERVAQILVVEDFEDLSSGESIRVQVLEIMAAAWQLERYEEYDDKSLRDLIYSLLRELRG